MFSLENIFNNWNILKQKLNLSTRSATPREREIRYISLGQNIGYEENGKGVNYKRPVVILKKLGNMYLCIAMTTKGRKDNKFYIKLNNSYFKKDSYIITSQSRSIDKKRFIVKIGQLSKSDFRNIQKKLKELWF